MKHIFRVPVDTKHFTDTIAKGKNFTELAPYMTAEAMERVPIAKEHKVHYWGSLPGSSNSKVFQQIEPGDELLCYRSGRYVALAVIAYTTINPRLARFSWGETSKGETWELIYFLKDIDFLSVDTATVNEQWSMKGGHVMGFSKLADERAQPFLQEHGSVAMFLEQLDKQFAKSA